ncbi:MAG TPA: glycosyltransferase family 2 protein [Gemmatimonadaceae bacterium]|nr:glycosyltransferase family 2 protein [Gemmatimonadaceae bacterium]
MKPAGPLISIIVPVHQGARTLPDALRALTESDLARDAWELIVVDDASTDDTPMIAAKYADCVVRLPGRPHGPAYARNRGVEVSRGAIIAFFDADVLVHPDALRRMIDVFMNEPDISAVFGAYDTQPTARGFVSQYRNLLHHYVHARSAGDAETFWAGCGAIRRDAFLTAGMYDEWRFTRPQIEDVELGHRLRALGHRIVLRPDIQCAHMKRWRLRDVIKADFNDRGVPWTRLLIQMGAMTKSTTLNLATVEKLNTVLLAVAVGLLMLAAALRSVNIAIGAIAALAFVVLVNRPLYVFFARERGFFFALGVIPLHMIYYLNNGFAVIYGWLLHHVFGEPAPDALTQAYSEVGAQMWPPVPSKGGKPAEK